MIRKVLFAILLAHSALIAQGKPSRIILQAGAPIPNAQVPGQGQIPPAQLPQSPLPQLPQLIPNPQVPGQVPLPPVIVPPVNQQPPPFATATSSPQTTNPPQTGGSTTASQQPVSPTPGSATTAPQTTTAPAPGTTGGTGTGTTTAPQVTGTTIPAPVIVTPVPVTAAPVTAAPTTARPTPFPTTRAPTTGEPTTSRPTPAPLPAGFEYGAWGQVCPIPVNEQDCLISGQEIYSKSINNGILNCDRTADCCKCGALQCGIAPGTNTISSPTMEAHGCLLFHAGDYAAYGVKKIIILGDPLSGPGGAQIECSGRSSCQETYFFGDSITQLMCNTQNACTGAIMDIYNPIDWFWIDCNGIESCKNAKITINIGQPIPDGSMCNPQYSNIRRFGGIKCAAMNSCDGLELIINNRGCDDVIFELLDLDQVNGAKFNFNGKIEISSCVCGPACNFASGLGKCFQNLERLICPDVRSCMNMIKTIINPMDMFYLECSNELSCAMADLTIDLEQDTSLPSFAVSEPVRFIQSLKFGGINSGRGATIHIHNHQFIDPQIPGQPVIVTIGVLECSALNSCQGLTIYTGDNVNIMHRICGSFEACNGCMIKKDEFDVGIPCNPDPTPIMPQPWNSPQQQPQQQQPQQPQFVPQGPPQFIPVGQQPQQQQQVPFVPQTQPQFIPGGPQI